MINDIMVEVRRPQDWEPSALIRSVQEQMENDSRVLVQEGVLEEDEEDDYFMAFEDLFAELPQSQSVLGMPSELWVMVAHYLPYAPLYNAVASRVLRIGEALCARAQLAIKADESGNEGAWIRCLEEMLGLLYRRPEIAYAQELDADVLARLAGDVYGVHLAGDNAIPESIGVDLYRVWALVLLHAVNSESQEVRSRAYCELGFVLRLNVLAASDAWIERIYEALFLGLESLGYPEYLSLFLAFVHGLKADVYSEEVRTFAFECLVTMVWLPEAQSLFEYIKSVLLDQHVQGRLSPDNAQIVDKLFIHPEQLFRFGLM